MHKQDCLNVSWLDFSLVILQLIMKSEKEPWKMHLNVFIYKSSLRWQSKDCLPNSVLRTRFYETSHQNIKNLKFFGALIPNTFQQKLLLICVCLSSNFVYLMGNLVVGRIYSYAYINETPSESAMNISVVFAVISTKISSHSLKSPPTWQWFFVIKPQT